jgi:hypothetical protein
VKLSVSQINPLVPLVVDAPLTIGGFAKLI